MLALICLRSDEIFLGGDYSLVFFKLPNQLEGIAKKTLLFEPFRRRRTWWYGLSSPRQGGQGKLG